MTDPDLVHSYASLMKHHILACMKKDNLVELIELLIELEDVESDSGLENGQVYASDGTVATL